MQFEFARSVDAIKQRALERPITICPSKAIVQLERMEPWTERRIGPFDQAQPSALPNHDPAQRDAEAARITCQPKFRWHA
ncbi:MAG TPA: hypothetical protein VFE41_35550 [Acetobacteraceae bacterium]|nr:hypothetical protein [Acetobacteraceae bacterium]